MAKPLTKSRFKLALECPTKLYYAAKAAEYYDRNQDNDFLQALADGGNQVGELAKFKYYDDPIGQKITIDTLDYDQAIGQTNQRLAQPGRVVIAEAAIAFAEMFVRVDILIRDQESKTIELIEVKSKSITTKIVDAQFRGSQGGFLAEWLPYLYDVAFQTGVARKAFPDYQIIPKLLLIDSTQDCDVDGLHQNFRIVSESVQSAARNRSRVRVQTPPGLNRSDLGTLNILREVDVSSVVDELLASPINNPKHIPTEHSATMITFMDWASDLQQSGKRHFEGVSRACKGCQFRADPTNPKLSGLHECWGLAIDAGRLIGTQDPMNRALPLSIDLWAGGGGQRVIPSVLEAKRAFLSDVQEDDFAANSSKGGSDKLSPLERRLAQIEAAASNSLDVTKSESRLAAMDEWEWPLHMIDFETSAPALPFFKGMRPYQTLAFQFSHHVMEKNRDGSVRIRHASQWISTQPGRYPSFDFVRSLKRALTSDGQLKGTIFRYHNHENTVLRGLRGALSKADPETVTDANELIEFIDLITRATGNDESGGHEGERQMVDLHRLVQEGYYSPHAGGSISIKYILPAILQDAPQVADLYRKPGIYGAGCIIDSLNFDNTGGHIWLRDDKDNDPYKTLPPIFGPNYGEIDAMLLRLAGDDDLADGAINQGGLAMTAYNFTQFAEMNEPDRKRIENALLRYCELDTLAMVILVQGLMELRGKPLIVSSGCQASR